jgi:hypothetical protein
MVYDDEFDKCGINNEALSKALLNMLGDHWGYGYDSLLIDLERWSESDYVSIDSIGASVQNRTLWELTITGPDSTAIENKKLVYIHARTHPSHFILSQCITRMVLNWNILDRMQMVWI